MKKIPLTNVLLFATVILLMASVGFLASALTTDNQGLFFAHQVTLLSANIIVATNLYIRRRKRKQVEAIPDEANEQSQSI